MANFTNTKINQTYQRVVQVDGSVIQDGLGNRLTGSLGTISITGSLGITGHSDVSASLTQLLNFSASLNDTFATDAELASVSSSLASETAQLLNFSASLDATFATDAELSSASSSLASSIDSSNTRITNLESFSSSLDATYATDSELSNVSSSLATTIDNIVHSDVSGLNAATSSYAIKTEISGSFNSLSSSIATRFDNIQHSDVSGLNTFTGSANTRITDLETFSSSLDTNYLSESEWSIASSSIQNDIAYDSGRIAILENKTLVSGSGQIDLGSATGTAANAVSSSYAVTSSNAVGYITIASLKTLVASSPTYNDFTASIAAL